jgi:(E)-4-hydroxy-3-methylbut-2-enyl-diphosphate synthase
VERYRSREASYETQAPASIPLPARLAYDPFSYQRRASQELGRAGGKQVPVVVADYSAESSITPESLQAVGYTYDAETDKWQIGDAAADYLYTGKTALSFAIPGTLQLVCDASLWRDMTDPSACQPLFSFIDYRNTDTVPGQAHWVRFDTADTASWEAVAALAADRPQLMLVLYSSHCHAMPSVRAFLQFLAMSGVKNPVILHVAATEESIDRQLIHFATDAGALLLDGMGDGIWLENLGHPVRNQRMSGRTYMEVRSNAQFLNNTAFSILQATRTRISKTEYISCPSCGRTLFDLQETTARIRAVTHHLKGVKIAIMGCIVNGPGEMADADFGYVGSGPGKITLYRNKDIVRRNVDSAVAVEALIDLLKSNGAWVEPPVPLR